MMKYMMEIIQRPMKNILGSWSTKGMGLFQKKCDPHTQANQENSNTYMDINAIETVGEINQETPYPNPNRYALPKLSREFSDPKTNEDASK